MSKVVEPEQVNESAPSVEDPQPTTSLSRRSFLGSAVIVGAASTLAPALAARAQSAAVPVADTALCGDALLAGDAAASVNGLGRIGPGERRRSQSFRVRVDAARANLQIPVPRHPNNGDEARYPNRIASYSKGLPHNVFGEVDPGAYQTLLAALASGRFDDFERIPSGNPDLRTRNKFTNPQSGLAFDLQGTDAHQVTSVSPDGTRGPAFAPAPRFDSAEEAGEIVENYWMALLRDVPFDQYRSNPMAQAAADDLSRLSDFRGPKRGGRVTPDTLFRADLPGALDGPYLSQFFLLAQPFGAQGIDPRVRVPTAGIQNDFLTDPDEWLAVQNGVNPTRTIEYDLASLRYMRTGRDLGEWVHIDVLFQAYFQAMLILLQPPLQDPAILVDPFRSGLGARVNPGNPYNASNNQIGFGTFGGPYIAQLVCEVATRALKAVWFQKWFVHRRLRPEEYGGRVYHFLMNGRDYPIHPEVLNSRALDETLRTYGTAFLPIQFPEGCPTHPAYGAGHATVAGACVTVLKAVFDDTFEIPRDRLRAVDAQGNLIGYPSDQPDLTIGGELDKLAANVALGRDIAGVHWRSDATESLKLGENIAISVLRDQRLTYNERFSGFTFRRFDGTLFTV